MNDTGGADCPFCSIASQRIFHAGRSVLGIWDGFPVSPGHALVIPKRHVASWFETTGEERAEMLQAIEVARAAIGERYAPDGFNLGINDGAAAGQTVFHVHLHVIPRYAGDVAEPRGGVRRVLPERADYRREATEDAGAAEGLGCAGAALVPGEEDPLLPHLLRCFDTARRAEIAVAFILPSGIEQLGPHLGEFLARGGRARILTGDYLDVSDPDALQRLLDLGQPGGDTDPLGLRVFETGGIGFHPKAYLFHDQGGPSVAFVGSSNLSRTALSRPGVEWNYRV